MSDLTQIAKAISSDMNRISSSGPNSLVEGTVGITQGLEAVANAIFPGGTGQDEAGGTVGCLTEALMGHTKALCQIATAIDGLAEAVRYRGT